MAETLQPGLLLFTPVYKPYVWGGASLPRRLGRADAPALDRYAESWELADHPDGMSVVEAGPYAGLTLHELGVRFGRALTGRDGAGFPLLVKVLDAADRLSVQVHPDDETARRDGGEAKTECWLILDAAPGAGVWCGLKPGVTPAAFRAALGAGTVPDLLQWIPVSRGDLLFIPGGRVHAIGASCLILEVQQSSNTTYRVFDWNRPGPDGKPRPLHVDQALRTIRWEDGRPAHAPASVPEPLAGGLRIPRLACPYFSIDEYAVRGPLGLPPAANGGFRAFFAAEGWVRFKFGNKEDVLPEGRTGLLPAGSPPCRLVPCGSEACLVAISGPA